MYNYKAFFLVFIIILTGCSSAKKNVCTDIFGRRFNAAGQVDKFNKESGGWRFTEANNELLSYGEYDQGFKSGSWYYIFDKDNAFETDWKEYANTVTGISISLPYAIVDTVLDDQMLRLRTRNDSLGFISILIRANNPVFKTEKFDSLYKLNNLDLKQLTRRFSYSVLKLQNSKGEYLVAEYTVKDSTENPARIYTVNGSSIEFGYSLEVSMFHEGPNHILVKEIFSSLMQNLYWNGKRFYNPYMKCTISPIAKGDEVN